MTHCDRQSPLVINIRQNRSVVIESLDFPQIYWRVLMSHFVNIPILHGATIAK